MGGCRFSAGCTGLCVCWSSTQGLTDGWGGQACMPSGHMLHRTVTYNQNLHKSPDMISNRAGRCEGGLMG